MKLLGLLEVRSDEPPLVELWHRRDERVLVGPVVQRARIVGHLLCLSWKQDFPSSVTASVEMRPCASRIRSLAPVISHTGCELLCRGAMRWLRNSLAAMPAFSCQDRPQGSATELLVLPAGGLLGQCGRDS